jgi:hypothetical protein
MVAAGAFVLVKNIMVTKCVYSNLIVTLNIQQDYLNNLWLE